MDRRRFLSTFVGATVGLTVSKELSESLIPWKDSTFLLPPADQTLLTHQVIMREFMKILEANIFLEREEVVPSLPRQIGYGEGRYYGGFGFAVRMAPSDLHLSKEEFVEKHLRLGALLMSRDIGLQALRQEAHSIQCCEPYFFSQSREHDVYARATQGGLSVGLISVYSKPEDARIMNFRMQCAIDGDAARLAA